MEGASVENLMQRIEAALTRIENAVPNAAASDEGLAVRHERLRTAVSQSLQQLDRLLASRQP
jgi:hypothetical protein